MASQHGVLVEVLGLGVLVVGPSAVGKSECALELIRRGHRLVADDRVGLVPRGGGVLAGSGLDPIRHHMEIRGIGIVDVRDLFGEDAVRDECDIELVCHLEPWGEGTEFERVGLDRGVFELGGVVRPLLVLPTRPGTSTATLIEVAVREHRARSEKGSAAGRLDATLRGERRP